MREGVSATECAAIMAIIITCVVILNMKWWRRK